MKRSEFDKDPWHVQISKAIEKRNRMCTAKDRDSVFDAPRNPFIWKSLSEFEKNNPIKQQGKLRCVQRKNIEKVMDKEKRYYKKPVSKKECTDVNPNAVWNATSTDRVSKYGKGVCWVNELEELCGNKTEKQCEDNKICSWHKNDCMTTDAVDRGYGNVNEPPSGMPKNITDDSANVQRYLYDWYVNKKHGPTPKVGKLFAEGNRCAKEEAEEDLPSLPQSVVNIVMKNINLKDSTNRGLLAWHSTGSGKTCTATGVMDSFWNSNKKIVFASSIDAIASNPPFKFHECSRLFFKRTEEDFEKRGIVFKTFAQLANCVSKVEKFKGAFKILSGGNPVSMPVDKRKSKMTLLVENVCSMYKLSDSEKVRAQLEKQRIQEVADFIDLDETVLIIDEVHNLFRPLPNQKEKHRFLEKHLVDPTLHPKLKVVILTATPGDNITDTLKLLNIVRDPINHVIIPPNLEKSEDLNKFKEDIRGLVSFFDMSSDKSKFPIVEDTDPVKFPMSKLQFEKYIEAYKKGTEKYEKLASTNQLQKYWQNARKYSNMLYNFEKKMTLTEFSSKLPGLLENIAKYQNEKQYVYSAFYTKQGSGQGIREIARQLELQGYKRLTLKDAKSTNLTKEKRYILALKEELGTGTNIGKNLHQLMKVYNSKENLNGELCQVFLASQGFNEGLDLKAVRHIHIFEPLVTAASDYQTIGRARRYCSHSDLDHSQWNVKIHRYISDFPRDVDLNTCQKIRNEVEAIEEKIKLQEEMMVDVSKEVKKTLKEEISQNKKALRELKKEMKAAEKSDINNVKNIDQVIYDEAKEHMRKLLTIHHCIKEAAVDCRLLHKFHGHQNVKCMT